MQLTNGNKNKFIGCAPEHWAWWDFGQLFRGFKQLYVRCWTAYKLRTKIRAAITLYGAVTVLYSKTLLNDSVACSCLTHEEQSNIFPTVCELIEIRKNIAFYFCIDSGDLVSIRTPIKNTRKMWSNFWYPFQYVGIVLRYFDGSFTNSRTWQMKLK